MPEQNKLGELERELLQLQAQLPKHSPSPAMLLRIEELEERIAALIAVGVPSDRPA